MNMRRSLFAVGLLTAALASGAIGRRDDDSRKGYVRDLLRSQGSQAEFNRGVAMLHSYWFLIARRTFEGEFFSRIPTAPSHIGAEIHARCRDQ